MQAKTHSFFLALLLALLGTLTLNTAWMAINPPVMAQDADADQDTDRENEEEHRRHLERSHQEMEHRLGVYEMATKFGQVVEADHTAAIFAIMHVHDVVEEPAEAIKLLEDALAKSGNDAVKRALRLKLVEFYNETDQRDKARKQLLNVIIGEAN